jgi:hypothetical protein
VSQEVLLAVGELKGLMIGIQNQLASGSKRMDEQDSEIESVRNAVAATAATVDTKIEKTNDRVNAVERRQAWYAGGIALFCFLLTVAGVVLPLVI